MKNEIIKTLRCKCGKQTYVADPEPAPPACPRCGGEQEYSDNWYIKVIVNGKRRLRSIGPQRRQAESVLREAHKELFQEKFFAHKGEQLFFSEAIKQIYERKWKKKKDGAKSLRRAEILQEIAGDIPLADIDADRYYDIIAALEERQGRGKKIAESTINRYRAALKTILRHHKQDFNFIELTPENGGRIRILTKEEEKQVIALFRDTDHSAPRQATSSERTRRSAKREHYSEMADYATVLIDTGMRANELLKLPPQDIDFATNLLTIWVNKADKPRSIPMTARVRGILNERCKRERLFNLNIHQADKAWEWARKEMGLEHDKEFVIHALRHTCCTRLLVKGIDIYRVKEWMGHRSIKTTEKYAHLDPQQLAAAAAALEEDDTGRQAKDIMPEILQASAEQLAAIMEILKGASPRTPRDAT